MVLLQAGEGVALPFLSVLQPQRSYKQALLKQVRLSPSFCVRSLLCWISSRGMLVLKPRPWRSAGPAQAGGETFQC